MINKLRVIIIVFAALTWTLPAVYAAAESISVSSSNYTHSLNNMHEALAAPPILPPVTERHPEAVPLSSSTGAWLISIGLIGFIVSRQRFRNRDEQ